MQDITKPELIMLHMKADGTATLSPALVHTENGQHLVRSVQVNAGPFGEPHRLSVEMLPTEVLVLMDRPTLAFTVDGIAIAKIVLVDGREIDFSQSPSSRET